MEKLLHPRLIWLFEYRLTQFLTGVAICVCGLLLLLPLPIPLSNMFPALTVVLAAAAFSERDGYCLIAAGLLFTLTLLFFAALAWGGAEALHWVGHSV